MVRLVVIILAFIFGVFIVGFLLPAKAGAEELDCITTEWKMIGSNHKVCTSSYKDPDIPQITCYIAQARTGGISGTVGLAEDPSIFSMSCIKTGDMPVDGKKIKKRQKVFSESTSILFKDTEVVRIYDEQADAVIYTAISRKIIKGSPFNAISAVPLK